MESKARSNSLFYRASYPKRSSDSKTGSHFSGCTLNAVVKGRIGDRQFFQVSLRLVLCLEFLRIKVDSKIAVLCSRISFDILLIHFKIVFFGLFL